ncbi:MAG TPA: DUF952 domain-containing protein [Chryseosolibacter sp.]
MIYHITTEKEWADSAAKAEYAPAAFEKEGFIHASRLNQLEGVMQRYYSGRADLLLLCIEERKLQCDLIYEPSANKELYPHLYGKLNKDAIAEIVTAFDFQKLGLLTRDR